MKFTCEAKELYDVVSGVSLAVAPKSTLPVLEGILLRCRGNKLTLSGYNLELGIRKVLPVAGEEDGDLVVSAKLFGEILRKLSGDILTFEGNEKQLIHLSCGGTEFTVLGMSPEEFPLLPEIEETGRVTLEQGKLKDMISRTIYAVAVSEAIPVITGTLFDVAGGTLKMVSVDGYQLAMRKEAAEHEDDFKFVVPGKALTEINKLLKESDEPVLIRVGKKHAQFTLSGYDVITRLLEGQFLDYNSSISGPTVTKVTVNKRLFSQSIDRASILITERIKSHIRCDFKDETIYLSCATSMGKIYDTVEAKAEGPSLSIGFSNRYMLNALRAADTDEVILEMKDPLSPIRMVPPEGDSYLYLVLPIRIKE